MYVPNWSAKALEEWKEESQGALETILGYQFKEPKRLQEAMTHPSFAHEAREEDVHHYERLEFLGDAVLELIVSHMLWDRFPHVSEGDLTRLRAELVKKKTLAKVARRLQIGQFILLGKGERQRGGNERSSILADAIEAILGAIFLDGGLTVARSVCLSIFTEEFSLIDLDHLHDYKNRLQELAASLQLEPPKYKLLEVEGPEHMPTFVMEVFIGETLQAQGRGRNKKDATQEAAHRLLDVLQAEALQAKEASSR